jgi:hypothetical protein
MEIQEEQQKPICEEEQAEDRPINREKMQAQFLEAMRERHAEYMKTLASRAPKNIINTETKQKPAEETPRDREGDDYQDPTPLPEYSQEEIIKRITSQRKEASKQKKKTMPSVSEIVAKTLVDHRGLIIAAGLTLGMGALLYYRYFGKSCCANAAALPEEAIEME